LVLVISFTVVYNGVSVEWICGAGSAVLKQVVASPPCNLGSCRITQEVHWAEYTLPFG